jgi:AcrR family transcriptional regulator
MVHVNNLRADAARNRERILEVARALISSRGSAVSMDAIAKEAGVAVGTIYRHHPTKAALIAAVVGQSVEQIADAAAAAVERVRAGAAPGHELSELFQLIAARHAADQAVKQAAAALGAYAPAADNAIAEGTAAHRAWQAIQRLLADAQQAGSARADLTPADLVALLAGVPGAEHPDDVRRRYVEIVLTGIGLPCRP